MVFLQSPVAIDLLLECHLSLSVLLGVLVLLKVLRDLFSSLPLAIRSPAGKGES